MIYSSFWQVNALVITDKRTGVKDTKQKGHFSWRNTLFTSIVASSLFRFSGAKSLCQLVVMMSIVVSGR